MTDILLAIGDAKQAEERLRQFVIEMREEFQLKHKGLDLNIIVSNSFFQDHTVGCYPVIQKAIEISECVPKS